MTHKKATMNELLRKIEENRNRRKKEHLIYCKHLDMEIPVKMIPIEEVLDILSSVDTNDFGEQMDAYKRIIYEHCPMLHNKNFQTEEYVQPYDVVFDVFGNNLNAIAEFSEKIIDLYGLGDVGEKVKNS